MLTLQLKSLIATSNNSAAVAERGLLSPDAVSSPLMDERNFTPGDPAISAEPIESIQELSSPCVKFSPSSSTFFFSSDPFFSCNLISCFGLSAIFAPRTCERCSASTALLLQLADLFIVYATDSYVATQSLLLWMGNISRWWRALRPSRGNFSNCVLRWMSLSKKYWHLCCKCNPSLLDRYCAPTLKWLDYPRL